MNRIIAWSAWIVLVVSSCTNTVECDLLISNVKLVDVQQDTCYAVQQIAITDGVIIDINGSVKYRGKQRLDAEGQYIMPGLWDNHVHFRGGDSLIEENEAFLPLFLKYGITTVRDAGGDLTPAVLQWRAEIASGQRNGPQIFTSGPKLDGPEPAWPGSIKIRSKEDVEQALDSLESLNVDYVKIYDGSLSAENYYDIIRSAESRGHKTTGHMPMDAYLGKAADLGLDGSEHMHYLSKACSPYEDSLTKLNKGYGILKDIYKEYHASHAKTVITTLAQKQFYVTPTLFISKTLTELADADHTDDAMLKVMGSGIIKTYQRRIDNAKRAKARGSTSRKDGLKMSMKMIRPMYDHGIIILAGSDCGAFNSYVYPGEALHEELKLMVLSGLSPAEALSTSIVNGPAFFDLQESYGLVAMGKQADLILLSKNPLDNIEHLSTITAVINQNKVQRIE